MRIHKSNWPIRVEYHSRLLFLLWLASHQGIWCLGMMVNLHECLKFNTQILSYDGCLEKTSNTVQTSMRAKNQVQDECTEGYAMSIRQYQANQLRRLEFAYVWFSTTISDYGWFSQWKTPTCQELFTCQSLLIIMYKQLKIDIRIH